METRIKKHYIGNHYTTVMRWTKGDMWGWPHYYFEMYWKSPDTGLAQTIDKSDPYPARNKQDRSKALRAYSRFMNHRKRSVGTG